jgi:hypothetical protein
MSKQYRDEIAMVCHDMMKSAYVAGAVTDSEMKEFEEDCFVEEPEAVHTIKKSPEMAHINA